jgi:hypothetical protein
VLLVFRPPQKSKFFAISPAKARFKKPVNDGKLRVLTEKPNLRLRNSLTTTVRSGALFSVIPEPPTAVSGIFTGPVYGKIPDKAPRIAVRGKQAPFRDDIIGHSANYAVKRAADDNRMTQGQALALR